MAVPESLVIVQPITVTESMLISCDVPETDYTEYAAVTTYGAGDYVRVTAAHKVYKSLQAGHAGKDPTLSANAAYWKEAGATNRFKCLDTKRSSQTVQASSMSYRIRPGRVVTRLLLANMLGDSVRVRMIDPTAGTVVDNTISLRAPVNTASGHAWHYQRRRRITKVLLTLPAYYGADVLVDLTATSGNVALGQLAMGYAQPIGAGVRLGLRAGIQDYSRKKVNEFGDTELQQLDFAERASYQLVIPNTELDAVKDQLTDLRATPVIVIGTRRYMATVVYGWIGEFEILIPYPTESECSLDVKGLT